MTYRFYYITETDLPIHIPITVTEVDADSYAEAWFEFGLEFFTRDNRNPI